MITKTLPRYLLVIWLASFVSTSVQAATITNNANVTDAVTQTVQHIYVGWDDPMLYLTPGASYDLDGAWIYYV